MLITTLMIVHATAIFLFFIIPFLVFLEPLDDILNEFHHAALGGAFEAGHRLQVPRAGGTALCGCHAHPAYT